MQRPYLVYVGGDDQQEIKALYLGTDGEKAQKTFDDAAQDGGNSIVRYCAFPEHSQIRTPRKDGVPPKPKPAAGDKKTKPPAAPAAPSQEEDDADDADDTASDDADADDHGI